MPTPGVNLRTLLEYYQLATNATCMGKCFVARNARAIEMLGQTPQNFSEVGRELICQDSADRAEAPPARI